MNKPVYVRLLILKISKTLMYKFWYDYINQIIKKKASLCYLDTNSFIAYLEIRDVFKGFVGNFGKRFDTSNYDEVEKPFLKRENKEVIRQMKNEIGGKIMTKFFGLRRKKYSYLSDDNRDDKKVKGTEKCVIK